MTFLAPIYLYLGAAVALGVTALHFIVTRQPASSPLPTVRFVPASSVRVTTIAPVPEDLLLLLLRVLLALVLGAAFARPVLTPDHRSVGRVVLADVSRDVARPEELRDSVRAVLGASDVLVAYDSAPRVIRRAARDSVARLMPSAVGARLSPALVAALRAAAELRESVDSIELVIVSPLRARALDGATGALRALWPGRARLVSVAARGDSVEPTGSVGVRAAASDPVAIGAIAAGLGGSDSAVRIVRGAASATDSAWAAGGGRTLVHWPADGAPAGWVPRARPDTAGAVVVGDAALVQPLERRWRLAPGAATARVIGRWVDGEPAAIERAVGKGCIRDVSIRLSGRGDLALRPAFGQLVRALAAPCAFVAGGRGVSAAERERLAGAGALAASTAIAPREAVATPLMPWLLGLALALLLAEPLVRRGGAAAVPERVAPAEAQRGAA